MRMPFRQFKERYILAVLAHHKGHQSKAAEALGMHRNTLSRTIAELKGDSDQIGNCLRRPVASDSPTSKHPLNGKSVQAKPYTALR